MSKLLKGNKGKPLSSTDKSVTIPTIREFFDLPKVEKVIKSSKFKKPVAKAVKKEQYEAYVKLFNLLQKQGSEESGEESEAEEEEEQEQEKKPAIKSFAKITIAALKEYLDEHGIEYDEDMKKQELYDLYQESFEESNPKPKKGKVIKRAPIKKPSPKKETLGLESSEEDLEKKKKTGGPKATKAVIKMKKKEEKEESEESEEEKGEGSEAEEEKSEGEGSEAEEEEEPKVKPSKTKTIIKLKPGKIVKKEEESEESEESEEEAPKTPKKVIIKTTVKSPVKSPRDIANIEEEIETGPEKLLIKGKPNIARFGEKTTEVELTEDARLKKLMECWVKSKNSTVSPRTKKT